MSGSTADATAIVKECALEAGFDLVKVTSADVFVRDREAALERINTGLMDGLPWYTESRVLKGSDPRQLLAGARSVISLGLSYFVSGNGDPAPPDAKSDAPSIGTGKVARYARGRDYHRVMKSRMRD
ncbi:MAG: DUF1730 domain-containing protein, partial [Chloroflexi bacterium]|nr:DUF1730 domain-containing protein [Chloroflexota bacterium]